jgi:sortase A
MELDVPVVLAPIISRSWQVNALGAERVGHLEGTASPGDPGNIVLAGHVTTAPNLTGPFAGLGRLQAGDRITVYAGEQAYAYRVDYQRLVERNDIQVTYPSSTGRITLITCSNWSNELRGYRQRLIVVGHLVDQ